MFCPVVVGAGACDRGAVTAGGLPQHDARPQPPSHGPQRTLRRGGVPGRVTPAPQQGVAGGQQACQCRLAQRSGKQNKTKKYLSSQLIAQKPTGCV